MNCDIGVVANNANTTICLDSLGNFSLFTTLLTPERVLFLLKMLLSHIFNNIVTYRGIIFIITTFEPEMRFVAGLERHFHAWEGVKSIRWKLSRYLYHPPFSEMNNVNLFLFKFPSCPLLVDVSVPILGAPFLSPVTKLRFNEGSSQRGSAISSQLLWNAAVKTHEDEIKTRVPKVNFYVTVLIAHLLLKRALKRLLFFYLLKRACDVMHDTAASVIWVSCLFVHVYFVSDFDVLCSKSCLFENTSWNKLCPIMQEK